MRKRSLLVVAALLCGALVLVSAACCSGAASSTTTTAVTPTSETVPEEATATIGWVDLQPAGASPAPRFAHSMVYDPTVGKVILFGGRHAEDYVDTWAFDPQRDSWTLLDPGGRRPWARHSHSMVYDPTRGKIIMFGGTSMAGYFTGLNDTWVYDSSANSWSMLTPAGDVPQARSAHAMGYDPNTKKMILFGGNAQSRCLGDTWAYDPATNTWAQLTPLGDIPSPRYGASLVFDPGLNKFLLFGGRDSADLNDLWSFDPAAGAWARLDPAGDVPSARSYAGMVYDPGTAQTILFGGNAQASGYLGDTWAYDSAADTWTKLEGDAPPARFACGLVLVPESGRALLFGGADRSATLADTWGFVSTR